MANPHEERREALNRAARGKPEPEHPTERHRTIAALDLLAVAFVALVLGLLVLTTVTHAAPNRVSTTPGVRLGADSLHRHLLPQRAGAAAPGAGPAQPPRSVPRTLSTTGRRLRP